MANSSDPILQITSRDHAPAKFPGSLTRLADLEADVWARDTRVDAAFKQTTRGQVETAIERLIGLLDTLDGDADTETIDEREPDHEGENSLQPVSLAWA